MALALVLVLLLALALVVVLVLVLILALLPGTTPPQLWAPNRKLPVLQGQCGTGSGSSAAGGPAAHWEPFHTYSIIIVLGFVFFFTQVS